MRSFTHRICDNDAKEKAWRGDSLQGPREQGVVLIKISVILCTLITANTQLRRCPCVCL